MYVKVVAARRQWLRRSNPGADWSSPTRAQPGGPPSLTAFIAVATSRDAVLTCCVRTRHLRVDRHLLASVGKNGPRRKASMSSGGRVVGKHVTQSDSSLGKKSSRAPI